MSLVYLDRKWRLSYATAKQPEQWPAGREHLRTNLGALQSGKCSGPLALERISSRIATTESLRAERFTSRSVQIVPAQGVCSEVMYCGSWHQSARELLKRRSEFGNNANMTKSHRTMPSRHERVSSFVPLVCMCPGCRTSCLHLDILEMTQSNFSLTYPTCIFVLELRPQLVLAVFLSQPPN